MLRYRGALRILSIRKRTKNKEKKNLKFIHAYNYSTRIVLVLSLDTAIDFLFRSSTHADVLCEMPKTKVSNAYEDHRRHVYYRNVLSWSIASNIIVRRIKDCTVDSAINIIGDDNRPSRSAPHTTFCSEKSVGVLLLYSSTR